MLYRSDDLWRRRTDRGLIGAEETIQPKYLWLRRHDDTLVAWADVRPPSTFGECRVRHRDGFNGGKVEYKVRTALGSEEALGRLIESEDVTANQLAREARPSQFMVPIKFNMEQETLL
jgi:hypothetical protein